MNPNSDPPRTPPRVIMRRRPIFVLVAGLLAMAYGVILLSFGASVPGGIPFGIGIVVVSAFLIFLWVRDRDVVSAGPDEPVPAGTRRFTLPGVWYPLALFGIVAAQVICYLLFVKK